MATKAKRTRFAKARANARALNSWDPDLAEQLAELGPVRLTPTLIGYSVSTSDDQKVEELGPERFEKWERIITMKSPGDREPSLLEAGFTPDEIESLGLCNLQEGGERSFGGYLNGSLFEDERSRQTLAEEQFMRLPATIRAHFGNTPSMLIAWLSHAKNEAHAMAMGIHRDCERYLDTFTGFIPARGFQNRQDIAERQAREAQERAEHDQLMREAAGPMGPLAGTPNVDAVQEAMRRREEAEQERAETEARKAKYAEA